MNILVTGSNGQLGNEMRVASANLPKHTFIFTDVAELDITNQAAVNQFFKQNKIDFVVNCAAYTDVNRAESDLEKAELINATAPKILADCCKEFGAKFIHVSTDYVFDGTAHLPYKETDKENPVSAYGTTKYHGEQNIVASGCEYVIIRTCWLYSSFGKNFVKTMANLGATKNELGVVFDQVGTPTYAADLANAIATIIVKTAQDPSAFVNGIYHFSNEGVCSWYDFTVAIMGLYNLNCCIKPLHTDEYPTPANRPAYSVLDKTKIKTTFGITIPHWYESLKECVKKLKD
ncbi:MAG: dTDP-4-dehydrorhamnose reductase [Bacteroidales bacterium]|nr:dTDP-4-dehydrorhamnose reductase [Bacteroidales bacterium]